MTAYKDLSREELLELKSGLEARFTEIKAKGLKLDMSRGKPSARTAESVHGYDGRIEQRRRSDLRRRS